MKRKSQIEIGNRCWIWKGRIVGNGYGRIKIDGKDQAIHRIVWEDIYGAIREGLEVHHRCGNRACCRPSHLRLDTHAAHMKRHALLPEERADNRRASARKSAKRQYWKKKAVGFRRMKRDGKLVWEKRPFTGPLYFEVPQKQNKTAI
jgi:HNH endonuclease